MNMQRMRRAFGGLAALLGAGLIIAGLALQRVDAMVLGLAALVIVMAGLAVGLRFRVATLATLVEQLSKMMQLQATTQLGDFRRVSNESTGLVLRSYRDMEIAHRDHAARMRETGEAIGSLSARVDELAEELARLERASASIKPALDDVSRSIEGASTRTFETLAATPGQVTEALHASLAPTIDTSERLMRQVIRDVRKVPAEVATAFDEFVHSKQKLNDLAYRALARIQHETLQEAEALMQLYRLFDVQAPMPLLGGLAKGWAMEPVTMLSVVDQVLSRKPGLVVECGSGTSTIWIAHALKRIGVGKLISLEHLEQYAQAGRAALDAHGLRGVAEIQKAPLQACQLGGESFEWYEVSSVEDVRDVAMLIVDGPPSSTGPLARYPALPLLRDRLLPGALILIDDAGREDEKNVVERWQQEDSALVNSRMISGRTMAFDYLPGRASGSVP